MGPCLPGNAGRVPLGPVVDQNFSFIQALAEHGYVIEKDRVVHEVGVQEFTQRRDVIETYLGVRRRARERTMGGTANVT